MVIKMEQSFHASHKPINVCKNRLRKEKKDALKGVSAEFQIVRSTTNSTLDNEYYCNALKYRLGTFKQIAG